MKFECVAPGFHKPQIHELCRLPESLCVSWENWIKDASRLNSDEVFYSNRIQNPTEPELRFRNPAFYSRNGVINMRVTRFSFRAVQDSNQVDRIFCAV